MEEATMAGWAGVSTFFLFLALGFTCIYFFLRSMLIMIPLYDCYLENIAFWVILFEKSLGWSFMNREVAKVCVGAFITLVIPWFYSDELWLATRGFGASELQRARVRDCSRMLWHGAVGFSGPFLVLEL